jgi:hypothetical protein
VEMSAYRAATLRNQGIIGEATNAFPRATGKRVIVATGGKTTSREENIAGLTSAINLAVIMKTTINDHYADATEHTTAIDNVNTLVAPAPTNIASLIVSVTEIITSYVAHDNDAELPANWVFHAAQEAGDHSLASVVPPVSLQECITRLIDIKAKYNGHDADATAHGVSGTNQEGTADPAYGTAIRVVAPMVKSGDSVAWSILDSGTGTVVGVSAIAGNGFVDFTFDADPQNDAVISCIVTG